MQALNAQEHIRACPASRESLIDKLAARRSALESSRQMSMDSLQFKTRLGMLFSNSGIISESELSHCLARAEELNALCRESACSQKPIGEVLIGMRLVDAEIVDAGLKVQERVRAGKLGLNRAIEGLKRMQLTLAQNEFEKRNAENDTNAGGIQKWQFLSLLRSCMRPECQKKCRALSDQTTDGLPAMRPFEEFLPLSGANANYPNTIAEQPKDEHKLGCSLYSLVYRGVLSVEESLLLYRLTLDSPADDHSRFGILPWYQSSQLDRMLSC